MTFTDQHNRTIDLDRKLGSGGEADVYAIRGRLDQVAKIYFAPSSERSAKLHAMVVDPPSDPSANQGHVSICWPQALLFNRNSRTCAGFLMHRVDFSRNVPVLQLYNPKDRQRIAPDFTWGYLVRTAANIASVVDAAHASGYVIGDVNESNFLVSDRALVTLVDCDSLQVPKPGGGGFFRCTVGKPDFTAPELQGRHFSELDRDPAHDNFALGVMIFHLLMEGVHPYAGVWVGGGDPPKLEERIRTGDCPYVGSPHVTPMPTALPFDVLPSALRSLFVRCFRYGHNNPAARPSPHEWKESLGALEGNLLTCSMNGRHVYPTHLQSCPWCERTGHLGGLDPYPLSISQQMPLQQAPFRGPQSRSSTSASVFAPILPQRRHPPLPHVASPVAAKKTRKAALVYGIMVGATLLVLIAIARERYVSEHGGPNPKVVADGDVKPSFDCTKANTPTELSICRNPGLASLERDMAATYYQALTRLPNDQKAALRREHSAWFKDFSRTCNASPTDDARKECIAVHVSSRAQELEARLPKSEGDKSLTGQAGPNAVPEPGRAPSEVLTIGALMVRGPSAAEVFIDGASKGSTDTQGVLAVMGLARGSHTILVRKTGYLDRQTSLDITGEQNESVTIDLQRAVGNLAIQTSPGAEVSVDGLEQGAADTQGHLAVDNLPAGTHRVSIHKSGYNESEMNVDLAAAETKKLLGVLTWAGGYLSVHAQPPGTVINIEGVEEFSGDWSDNPCPAGAYTITASHTGMKTERRIVNIRPGEHATVRFSLSPDITYAVNVPNTGTVRTPPTVSQPLSSRLSTLVPPSLVSSLNQQSQSVAEFQTAAADVLRERGSVVIELMHEHSGLSGDSIHPATLTLTPSTITYDPGGWSCKYSRFSAPLGDIEAAEVSNKVAEGKVIGVVVRHLMPGTYLLHLEVRDPAKSNARVKLYMAIADSHLVKNGNNVNYLASQQDSAEALGAVVNVIHQARAAAH